MDYAVSGPNLLPKESIKVLNRPLVLRLTHIKGEVGEIKSRNGRSFLFARLEARQDEAHEMVLAIYGEGEVSRHS